MKHFLTSALGVIGAGIAAAFGGWGAGMTTLCIFMAVDYVTGLLVAGVFHASKKSESGRLDSRAGFKGLLRKGMILLIVLIAARLDILLNTTIVRDAVVIAFCANEAISIVENAGLMGVPIPAALRRAIEALEQKGGAAAENNKSNTSIQPADDDLTPEDADCRIKIQNPELHMDGEDE
jgi:toxin secretion/phage lysis holin